MYQRVCTICHSMCTPPPSHSHYPSYSVFLLLTDFQTLIHILLLSKCLSRSLSTPHRHIQRTQMHQPSVVMHERPVDSVGIKLKRCCPRCVVTQHIRTMIWPLIHNHLLFVPLPKPFTCTISPMILTENAFLRQAGTGSYIFFSL